MTGNTARSGSGRGLAGAVLLLIGSLALLAGLGEAIARWTSGPAANPGAAGAPEADLPILRTFRDIARPDARGIFEGAYYRTNRHGLRSPERARSPAPGVLRVAIAGDSVTMGQGVLEADAYPAQLQRMLDARKTGPRYEVINLGLSALNATGAVNRVERALRWYELDAVVYGFTINDIEGPLYRRLVEEYAGVALKRRYQRHQDSPSHLVRRLWPRWVALGERFAPTTAEYFAEIFLNYFENPEAWEHFVGALDRLARLERERGLCALVFLHVKLSTDTGLDAEHPWHRIYDRVAAAASARGLPVIHSFPAFEGADPMALRLSRWDAHPNPEGHRRLALALLPAFTDLTRCVEKVRAS